MKHLLLAALLLASPLAPAAEAPASTAGKIVIRDVGKFVDHQRELREDMKSDRKFRHVDNVTKRRFYEAQDRIFGLLEGRRSVDELGPEQQLELFEAQGVVNAVLVDADLDREVCKREKGIGSHRVTTVCRTKRELQAQQDDTRRQLSGPRNCGSGEACTGR